MIAQEDAMQLLAAAQRAMAEAVRVQKEARIRIHELEGEVQRLRLELEQVRAVGQFGFQKGGARA